LPSVVTAVSFLNSEDQSSNITFSIVLLLARVRDDCHKWCLYYKHQKWV